LNILFNNTNTIIMASDKTDHDVPPMMENDRTTKRRKRVDAVAFLIKEIEDLENIQRIGEDDEKRNKQLFQQQENTISLMRNKINELKASRDKLLAEQAKANVQKANDDREITRLTYIVRDLERKLKQALPPRPRSPRSDSRDVRPPPRSYSRVSNKREYATIKLYNNFYNMKEIIKSGGCELQLLGRECRHCSSRPVCCYNYMIDGLCSSVNCTHNHHRIIPNFCRANYIKQNKTFISMSGTLYQIILLLDDDGSLKIADKHNVFVNPKPRSILYKHQRIINNAIKYHYQ
jgi:hypothetical protein